MRNLKKILALVLALVMSLSLMATAGAAETAAAAADPYATAQTVLTGLKVFRGDTAGQMNWNQPITRVQTAALVYRINTGDVDDTKAGLHTSNPFADVAASYWGNSYISYGYNAGILKGMGGNNFAPDNQVTGYQTLAMILRAMGYGRNGEFEGTGWEVRTASTAQSLGLLKNVTPSDSTTLGQPASRGLVAEILLRALLTNKVMYSALNPYNYTELDEKLADNLGLEEQTGVVIANEWAALDDTKPLAADKTKVQVADGTYRTLDWGAESYAAGIEDIGQSRSIYIQNGSKVLLLADSGKNVVKFNNGEGKTRAAVADGLTTSTAEYYDNFDPAVVHYCDMRIEYNLRFVNNTAAELFFDKYCTASWADVKDTMDEDNSAAAAGYEYAYVKVIAADADISDTEMAIMKGIFTIADNTNRTLGIDGSVFVGTKSETGDYSDSASYKTFVEKELKERADPISSVGNGNELRIVDNNNDGAAEYVLRINYDLDTIVETKNDKFYYKGLDITKFTPAPIDGYTQTVGDVVLYAKIDGKAYVHKADTASATFKAIDYKNVIATDTEGKEWKQSAIGNYTALPDKLVEVDENTSYNMYLDDYGYVRAYDNKVSYALLTEVYPTQTQNTAWVVDRELTAEAMPVGEKAVKEYKVLNSYYNGTSNPFYTPYAWKYPGITTAWNNRYDTVWHGVVNYLQPATHMLGVSGQERDKFWYEDTDRFVAWSEAAQRWVIKDEYADAFANSWNIGRDELNLNSWTNVAKYTQTSEGLNLYTAASHNGAKAVTDYIRLDRRNTDWNRINKTNPLFMIDDPYYNEIYTSAQTHYVRTVDSTVFYMVVVNESGVQGIRQYTGYSNLPTITDVNNVRSMYAVARNTAVNTDGNDYWVADVVVIEMYDYDVYESVSLIYSNNYKNQGDVKYLEALDSELGPIGIIPNNITVWNGQFTDYGFYGLNNVTVFDAEKKLYNADIVKITDNTASDDFGWYEGYGDGNNYNKHGIYYGQVRSIYAEDNLSDYVTIDVLDINGLVVDTVDVRVASYGGAYAINKKTNYNESIDLLLKSTTTNNQVKVGDKVMWVENDNTARTAGFLVDLTDVDVVDAITGLTKNRDWDTPSFLDVTEAGRLGRAQWVDGNNHYFGDPAAAYTYEEIIGKHNDRTAVKSVYAPQDGFVVSSYTLSINGVEIDPVFSGVMSDGLWHIRYNLNNNANDTVVISVERATDKDLVLNTPTTKLPANVRSTKYPNGVEVKGTGTNDIFGTANNYGAESWYFTMPALKVNEKIVGNIFADGTTIPSAYTTAGKFLYTYNETVIVPGTPGPVDPTDPDAEIKAELAAAKTSAVTALETAAKTETDKLDPVADAAKIEAVNAALAAAVEAVNGVTLDEYKADKESVAKAQAAGEEAIAEAAKPDDPTGITQVTLNARLFGSSQTDVETGEVKYFTFKPITVDAVDGVFTLTQAALDALEPDGFTATLTGIVAGEGYTVKTVETGWEVTAAKNAITLEVDFDASSFNGEAGGNGGGAEEVDPDHVQGSGSGSGSVTIEPVERMARTLSARAVEVGKKYKVTVTPDEGSVITDVQFLKCLEESRTKDGESWVCIVTVLAEDYLVKYVAEKVGTEEITVKFTVEADEAGAKWADYINLSVNDEPYTEDTKLTSGNRYTIAASAKDGLDPDVVLSWTINGKTGNLSILKDSDIREVVVALTVESLKNIKFDARAAIDAAVDAVDQSKLTAEQIGKIEAAVANSKKTIDQVNTKALVNEAVESFETQLAKILEDTPAVNTAKVDTNAKTVTADWFDQDKEAKLNRDSAMAIVNNNDKGMTFQPVGGLTDADYESGIFKVLDENNVIYDVTIGRQYTVTIDGKFVGYVSNPKSGTLSGIEDGLYFDARDTTVVARAAVGKKVYAASGGTLTLSADTKADVELISGVKITLDDSKTAVSSPFNSKVTAGANGDAVSTGNYVRKGETVNIAAITIGDKSSDKEYRFELRKDGEVVRERGTGTSGDLEAYSFQAIPAEGTNEIKIELAGGVDVKVGGETLFATKPSAAVEISKTGLADGNYMVFSTNTGNVKVFVTNADNANLATVTNGTLGIPAAAIDNNYLDEDKNLVLVPAVTVEILSGGSGAAFESAAFAVAHPDLAASEDVSSPGNGSASVNLYVAQGAELVITGSADSKKLIPTSKLITTVTAPGEKTGTPVESVTGTAADGKPTWTIALDSLGTYNFKVEEAITAIDLSDKDTGLNIDLKNGDVALADEPAAAVSTPNSSLKSWSGTFSTEADDDTIITTPGRFQADDYVTGTITVVAADEGFFISPDIVKSGITVVDGVRVNNATVSDDGKTLTFDVAFTVVDTN